CGVRGAELDVTRHVTSGHRPYPQIWGCADPNPGASRREHLAGRCNCGHTNGSWFTAIIHRVNLGGSMPEKGFTSPLRFAAAAMCVVAAAAHVPLIRGHLEQAPYLGVLFIAFTVACLIAAVLLLRSDSRFVWRAVAVTGAAGVLAYYWSRSFGLPQ